MNYAHLFDHDNIYVNKLEAIIDRFLEICSVPVKDYENIRKKLVGLVSLDSLGNLVTKLPKEQQGVLKTILLSPTLEEIEKIKKQFSPEDILNEFHRSAKEILGGKYNLIKEKLLPEKAQEVEDLMLLIGVF